MHLLTGCNGLRQAEEREICFIFDLPRHCSPRCHTGARILTHSGVHAETAQFTGREIGRRVVCPDPRSAFNLAVPGLSIFPGRLRIVMPSSLCAVTLPQP